MYTKSPFLSSKSAFTEDDVALYRVVNTHQSIIDLIPKFEIDTEIYDVTNIQRNLVLNILCIKMS